MTATFAKRMGGNVRRHRSAVGLSQERLAELAGLHRTAVGRIERGERVPRADTLVRMATPLEVDPGQFFAGMQWKTPPATVGEMEINELGGEVDR
jgi:transcriptional regulator with XRE-family HTH domain